MNSETEIRESVAQAYTEKVRQNSCCAGKPNNGVAKLSEYAEDELAKLPSDAVSNSFGCGNPLAFSQVEEGDTVLDLGSGAGIDLMIASEKVGQNGRVIGVDMTDEMIKHAKRNIKESGANNIEVRKGIIEDLPVESASVDWVVSNCVVNLSANKNRVFSEIARVLKPGGQILISDIVLQQNGLPEWIKQDSALYNACVSGAISEEDYVAGLGAAGLEDVNIVDRFVFDSATIGSLLSSGELVGAEDFLKEYAEDEKEEIIAKVLAAAEGKVWSARIHARAPQ